MMIAVFLCFSLLSKKTKSQISNTQIACPTGFHLIDSKISTLIDEICQENRCNCENGIPSTGADCPTHENSKCESCDIGFTLDQNLFECFESDNVAKLYTKKDCYCENGQFDRHVNCTGRQGLLEKYNYGSKINSLEMCLSCNSGYQLTSNLLCRKIPNRRPNYVYVEDAYVDDFIGPLSTTKMIFGLILLLLIIIALFLCISVLFNQIKNRYFGELREQKLQNRRKGAALLRQRIGERLSAVVQKRNDLRDRRIQKINSIKQTFTENHPELAAKISDRKQSLTEKHAQVRAKRLEIQDNIAKSEFVQNVKEKHSQVRAKRIETQEAVIPLVVEKHAKVRAKRLELQDSLGKKIIERKELRKKQFSSFISRMSSFGKKSHSSEPKLNEIPNLDYGNKDSILDISSYDSLYNAIDSIAEKTTKAMKKRRRRALSLEGLANHDGKIWEAEMRAASLSGTLQKRTNSSDFKTIVSDQGQQVYHSSQPHFVTMEYSSLIQPDQYQSDNNNNPDPKYHYMV